MRILYDTETPTKYYADGVPDFVCLTWAPEHDRKTGRIAVGDDAIDLWDSWIDDPEVTLGAHNAPFDVCVMAKASAKRRGIYTAPGFGPAFESVFRAYDQGRIIDTIPDQRLIDVANGYPADDTRMGTLAKRLLHIDMSDDKKMPKAWAHLLGTPVHMWPPEAREATPWRFKYGLLAGVPLEDWPDEPRRYACEDPVITWAIREWQIKAARKIWGHGKPITNSREQTRAALDLHLHSVTGFATDRPRVQKIAALYTTIRETCSDMLVKHCAYCGAAVPPNPLDWQIKDALADGAEPGDPRLGHCPKCKERATIIYEKRSWFPLKNGKPRIRLGAIMTPTVERKSSRKIKQSLVWRVLGAGAPLTKTARQKRFQPGPTTVSSDADTLIKVSAVLANGREGLLGMPETLAAASDGTLAARIAASPLPTINAVRLFARADKYLSAFLAPLDTDRRVRTSYQVCKDTGRTSARKPNVQNFPRPDPDIPSDLDIRSCIIPDQGKVFLVCDYSQIELVGLAHVLNKIGEMRGRGEGYQSSLAQALNAGMDGHIMVASEVLQCSYEETLAAYKSAKRKKDRGEILTEFEALVVKWRQVGKIQNYGAAGGMGAVTFVTHASKQDAIISLAESHMVRDAWMRAWSPDIPDYFRTMSDLTQHSGRADMIQLYSGRMRGKCTFTQACNCLDEDTEALTRSRGWVKGFDLQAGEEILAKDPKSGELRWEVCDVRKWANYSGDLHHFKNSNTEIVSTPDHRWLVSLKSGKVCERLTKNISDCGSHKIHLTGDWPDCEDRFGELFCSLAGWVLTDGSYKGNHAMVLYQTKADGIEDIERVLAGLALRFSKNESREGAFSYYVNMCDTTKRIRALLPERKITIPFMESLSKRELAALFDAMMLGDGAGKGPGQSPSFTAGTEDGANLFQILCTLCGKASKIVSRPGGTAVIKSTGQEVRGGKYWVVHVKRRDKMHVLKGHRKVRHVTNARVWCPVVPSTFFVARRKGFVFVTGNTLFQGLCVDGFKAALRLIIDACFRQPESPLYGSLPVLEAHDEDVVSCDDPLIAWASDERIALEEAWRHFRAAERRTPDARSDYDAAIIARARREANELSRLMIAGMAKYIPDIKIEAECDIMTRWGKG